MAQFITTADYDASIHREILDALLRKDSTSYDPQIVEICEDRAIAEMRSYLDKTYDCEAVFSAQGSARHNLILMFAIDIAVYHIFCIHNPYKISAVRKERYERAVEWLKQVMNGDVTISGAPTLPEEQIYSNARWQIDADDARPVFI